MAIINVLNKKVVLPNYDYSEKYWPILSKLIFDEVGLTEIKDPPRVEELLKGCFTAFCVIFDDEITKQNKASFYIFCHTIHEDSIELWQEQIKKNELGINMEDFAASRRVLKIILEQSCKLNLTGAPVFLEEIKANINEFTKSLEELLYLGSWCIVLSEYIARSQLFPNSIGLQIIESKLNILTYPPYNSLYEFTFKEMPKHNSNVALSNSIIGFKETLIDQYNVDYNVLASFITDQLTKPIYKFALGNIVELINLISNELNYDKEFLKCFYSGLTITKANSLSIEECILNNQNENRYMYRPILELIVDDDTYHMIGYNKWLESLTTLTTNSFPFGLYPSEWKEYDKIKEFVLEQERTHDKLLETPVVEILENNLLFNDLNVESFEQANSNNVNIKNEIGDFDILFCDPQNEILYVCECKHNRSRFDMNNWKRDYSNFKRKYEAQLDRKVNWAQVNKEIIQNHFICKYGDKFNLRLVEFEIRGIFIINAPTIYMFNGKYRAFTISGLQDLVNGNYVETKFIFTIEDTGREFMIEHPYFDNLKDEMNSISTIWHLIWMKLKLVPQLFKVSFSYVLRSLLTGINRNMHFRGQG